MNENIKVNGIGFNFIQLIKMVDDGKESFYEFFKERVWTEYNDDSQLRFIDEIWLMALNGKKELSNEKEVIQPTKSKSK